MKSELQRIWLTDENGRIRKCDWGKKSACGGSHYLDHNIYTEPVEKCLSCARERKLTPAEITSLRLRGVTL